MSHQVSVLTALGFADPLTDADRELLLAQAAALLENLADGKYGSLPHWDEEIFALFSPYSQDRAPTDDALTDVRGHLHNQRILDVTLIPSMLATLAPVTVSRLEYNALQAWVLYSSTGIVLEHFRRLPTDQLNNNTSLPPGKFGIDEAARRVRLLSEKYFASFYFLPNFSNGFNELYQQLDDNRHTASKPASIIDTTSRLLLSVMRNFVSKRLERIERDSEPEETVEINEPRIQLTHSSSNDGDLVIDEYQDRFKAPIPAVSQREQSNDRVKAVRVLRVQQRTMTRPRSRLAERFQAQAIVNRLAIRNIDPTCAWHRLTQREQLILLRECWTQALAAEPSALILVLMLLLGRSNKQLQILLKTKKAEFEGQHFVITHQTSICFAITIQLPTPTVDASAANLLSYPQSTLMLLLPRELDDSISAFLDKTQSIPEDIEQQLLTKIRALNDVHGTRYTLPRIAGDLAGRLTAWVDDPVEIDLICGVDPAHTPAMFYYAPVGRQLCAIHQEDNRRLLQAAGISVSYAELDQSIRVGSRLLVDSRYVGRLFTIQSERLREMLRHSTLEEFHTEYTLYVYQLLALATGYRPVTAPFELRTDFDLLRGTLWISEKESRSGLAARVVVLPDLVIRQLEMYDLHLAYMANITALEQSPHAQKFQDALHGDGPYLLLCDRGRWQPIRPRLLIQAMKNRFPIPLNWGRHFLRTRLRDEGIPGHLVNAWLGHEKFGDEAGGPWSGLSYKDLKSVAQCLNTVLTGFGIGVVAGFGSGGNHV